MTYVILDMDTRVRLDRLCQLGARPRVILELMPTLKQSIVSQHWRHNNKRVPPRGASTSTPTSYWATAKLRLHASVALQTYLRIESSRVNFVDAYIKAYEEYVTQFDDTECFDWFWGLIQNYINGRISVIECSCCGANYIHNVDDLPNDRNCPTHKAMDISEAPSKDAKGKPAAYTAASTETSSKMGQRRYNQPRMATALRLPSPSQ